MVAVPSTMLPLGTPVPDFRLPDPDGKLHGPADVFGGIQGDHVGVVARR
ncbi:hypothetical protein [uncultured Mycobacterium sp.]